MKSDCHLAEFFLSLLFFLSLMPLFAPRAASAAGELRGDLAVSFDPAAHSLSGTVRFNLAAGEQLALQTEGLEIGSVVVDGKKQEVSIGEDGLL
ncbi:MAG: hypothetical protein KJ717_12985, partial [Proteobacteria bacterium]|nr:hypothetical protein [Pseudomonadota bacterium]